MPARPRLYNHLRQSRRIGRPLAGRLQVKSRFAAHAGGPQPPQHNNLVTTKQQRSVESGSASAGKGPAPLDSETRSPRRPAIIGILLAVLAGGVTYAVATHYDSGGSLTADSHDKASGARVAPRPLGRV